MTEYRGYAILVTERNFRVTAPDGASMVFTSMVSVRRWVRRRTRLERLTV